MRCLSRFVAGLTPTTGRRMPAVRRQSNVKLFSGSPVFIPHRVRFVTENFLFEVCVESALSNCQLRIVPRSWKLHPGQFVVRLQCRHSTSRSVTPGKTLKPNAPDNYMDYMQSVMITQVRRAASYTYSRLETYFQDFLDRHHFAIAIGQGFKNSR